MSRYSPSQGRLEAVQFRDSRECHASPQAEATVSVSIIMVSLRSNF